MLLRRLCRAISRRSYNQLSALKPVFGLACPGSPLWWTKELRARQHLHDLPPKGGWWPADHDQILPLITAISWHRSRVGSVGIPAALIALNLRGVVPSPLS